MHGRQSGAACSKCNVRKSAQPLEKWSQRAIRKPIKSAYGEPSAWDGLSTVFLVLAERHLGRLSKVDREWLIVLKRVALREAV